MISRTESIYTGLTIDNP